MTTTAAAVAVDAADGSAIPKGIRKPRGAVGMTTMMIAAARPVPGAGKTTTTRTVAVAAADAADGSAIPEVTRKPPVGVATTMTIAAVRPGPEAGTTMTTIVAVEAAAAAAGSAIQRDTPKQRVGAGR